jgi:hypothetical protein
VQFDADNINVFKGDLQSRDGFAALGKAKIVHYGVVICLLDNAVWYWNIGGITMWGRVRLARAARISE